MAWDTDLMKEDAKKLWESTPPGFIGKGIMGVVDKIRGNEDEIMKGVRRLIERNPTMPIGKIIRLLVERYNIPQEKAETLAKSAISTTRGLGPDAGAETAEAPSRRRSPDARDWLDRKDWKDLDPGMMIPEPKVHPDAPQVPHHLDVNPLQTMEFRDYNQDGIEDRSQGIYSQDRDLIPWDPDRESKWFRENPFLEKMREGRLEQYNMNKGGRVGYQTGGITEQRNLPPEYVEALGKTYAADLTRQAGIPSITTATAQQPGETAQQWQQRQAQAQQYGITKAGMAELAPQVAAQDPYQAAAYAQAVDPTTGLGGYQPYLTAAGTAAQAAGALTGPGAGTGAGSIASYMSPYQQQVIDATMADYDAQAAKSRLGLGEQAVSGGAFGSGRHGIAEAEFDALSGRGRASMLADLRQRGFQQASTARQQDLANQIGLTNLQSGLGQTQQDFARSQIAGLGGLGATQQAQNQAILDAQRQFATMAVQEPRDRLAMLGQGVAGLSGLGSITATETPQQQSSPLGTALGYGLMGADIYGRIFKGQS